MKLLTSILLIFLSAHLATAQSFGEQYNKMVELYKAKDYEGALQVGKKIEQEAPQKFGEDTEKLSSFYYNLGSLSANTGDADEAIQYLQKARTIREKVFGKDHPQYAKVLDKMAKIYRAMGQDDKAEALYKSIVKDTGDDPKSMIKLAHMYLQKGDINNAKPLLQKSLQLLGSQKNSELYAKALDLNGVIQFAEGNYQDAATKLQEAKKIYENLGKTSSPSYYDVVNNLLVANDALGKYDETIPAYQKLLDYQAQKFGKDSDTYLNTLQSLGSAYISNEQYDNADRTISQLISTLESKSKTNTILYADALNDQGRVKFFKGSYAYSEILFKKSIDLLKQLGIKDDNYTNALLNLGNAYIKNNNDLKASQSYQEVATIQKNKLGQNHPSYAKTLYSLAMLEANQSHNDKAINILNQCIQIQKKTLHQEHPHYLRTVYALANQYFIKGDYDHSKKMYQEFVNLAQKRYGQNSIKYANALRDLGGLYYETGDYNASEKYLQKSVQIYQLYKQKDPHAYLNAIENLAVLYKNMGYYSESKRLLNDAINFTKEKYGETHPTYAQLSDELAVLYKTTGHYDKAEKLHLKNLLIIGKNQGKDHLDYAISLNNLGNLYMTMGKYSQAETNLNTALKIRKSKLGTHNYLYAQTLQNLGNLYVVMGRYTDAEKALRKALKITGKTQGKNHPDYALALNQLAALYQKTNNSLEVEQLYKEVLQIRKNALGEDSPEYAATLDNLANYYLNTGKLDQAKIYYDEAKQVIANKYGTKHPAYASNLNNLAILFESKGKYKEAENYYKESINIIGNSLGPQHPKFAKILNNLAILYDDQKKYPQAEELYTKAVDIALGQINTSFKSLSEEEKQLFLNTNKPFFDNFMIFAAHQGQRNQSAQILQKAYNLQLATKGIVLNATNRVRQNILNSKDQELIEDYKRWQLTRQAISDAYNLGEAKQKKLKLNLDSLKTQATALERKISNKSTEFGTVFGSNSIDWKQVQAKLKSDEAAIEISRLQTADKVLYVFMIVKANKANPEVLILNEGIKMEKYINYYKNAIRFKKDDKITYDEFWKPLEPFLKGIKKVYLSTDGIYNSMNILSLYNPTDNTYLIDKINIINVTNTKDIIESNTTAKIKDAFLLGNPSFQIDKSLGQNVEEMDMDNQNQSWLANTRFRALPGTKVEIEKINQILDTKGISTNTFKEETATEANLKKVKSPSLLHIATHGFFIPESKKDKVRSSLDLDSDLMELEKVNPMLNSGLVLAGVTDHFAYGIRQKIGHEDGILTAYEASNLNLQNTDLVVLSACETGLGKIQNGEGVYGLQRAFKIAGAKTVIMSLWKVNDEASQKLLVNFYQKWQSGMPKRKAFEEAQKELMKEYKHPYFWGAFVMLD